MALLYLKRLVFPSERKATDGPNHQLLQHSLTQLDIERASSPSSEHSTLCNAVEDYAEVLDEKSTMATSDSSTMRDARIVSDAIIGLSDGLTVPFALSAGLSALGDSNIVIYGGLAEIFAGVISMGLGGYLGSRSEAEAFLATKKATEAMVVHDRERAENEIIQTFSDFHLPCSLIQPMISHLETSPSLMVEFILRFRHQMSAAEFAPHRAYISALTIGLGYFVGGFVPLVPYFFLSTVAEAFRVSVLVMIAALFAFGCIKTVVVGGNGVGQVSIGGIQMVVLGGLAAAAAIGCVKAVS